MACCINTNSIVILIDKISEKINFIRLLWPHRLGNKEKGIIIMWTLG